MTFEEECASLAPLQTFDPAAFVSDGQIPQNLCNFVLTLALIYNDCKDVIGAHVLLQQSKPDGPFRKTRRWGAFAGVLWHIMRLFISLLHELLELIRKNEAALEHPVMKEVIRHLNPKARQGWSELVNIALDKQPKDKLGRFILLIRNKVVFHYDPKCLFRGYKNHFIGQDQKDVHAFVSRGSSMSASRFYFADAAALGYLLETVGTENLDSFMNRLVDLLGTLNVSLMTVVHGFIQKRGFAYLVASEDGDVKKGQARDKPEK